MKTEIPKHIHDMTFGEAKECLIGCMEESRELNKKKAWIDRELKEIKAARLLLLNQMKRNYFEHEDLVISKRFRDKILGVDIKLLEKNVDPDIMKKLWSIDHMTIRKYIKLGEIDPSMENSIVKDIPSVFTVVKEKEFKILK